MIESFLEKFKHGNRKDFERLIIPKLSDILSDIQKKNKIKNILQSMKNENRVRLDNKIWIKF